MAVSPVVSDVSEVLPPHVEVAEKVLGLVRELGLKPGDKLPSERELGRAFGVGPQHARMAIQLLARDQHLERKVGSGTYLRSTVESMEASLAEWLRQRPVVRDRVKIGVILVSASDYFLGGLFDELSSIARIRDVEILIRTAVPDYQGLVRAERDLSRDGCVGIILLQEGNVPTSDIVRFVLDARLPVSLPRRIPGLEGSFFEAPEDYGSSDRHIVRLAVSYLLGLGRDRLAYFGPESGQSPGAANRIDAFAGCASRENIAVRFALYSDEPREIDECLRQWKREGLVDGVCCYDDNYAMRLLSSALRVGVLVPDQLSVIGVNNTSLADHCVPSLSSIRYDYRYIAQGILDHVLSRAGISFTAERHTKRLGLAIRRSCGGRMGDSGTLARQLGDECGLPVDVSIKN